jgi:hypothetical protein
LAPLPPDADLKLIPSITVSPSFGTRDVLTKDPLQSFRQLIFLAYCALWRLPEFVPQLQDPLQGTNIIDAIMN